MYEVLSLVTETRVFNKNQRHILLPEDALYILDPSTFRKAQFLAKVVQSV